MALIATYMTMDYLHHYCIFEPILTVVISLTQSLQRRALHTIAKTNT